MGYQRLQRADAFTSALSEMDIHNHLNRAYHSADMYQVAPPYELMWWIPAIFVPARVRSFVNTDKVIADIRAKLVIAREIVDEDRDRLDVVTKRRIHHIPDRPYRHLHSSVYVEYRIVEGYAPSWEYSFNSYALAVELILDYEAFLNEVAKSKRSSFTKVSRIWRKAHAHRHSADLVRSSLTNL